MKMSSEISLTRARCAAARIPVALVCAFTLAGCGGGGGSRSPASIDFSSPAQFRTSAAEAARATPRPGSVTQSSNVNDAGVTLDEISAEADYDDSGVLRISIDNERGGREPITTEHEDTEQSESLTSSITGITYQRRVLFRESSAGEEYAIVYTDRMNAADTDYLVGGLWAFIPANADALDDIEFGAFADGPDANLTSAAYLATISTASYRGDAIGLYAGVDDGGPVAGDFESTVTLNAEFGGSGPVISGQMFNVHTRDLDEDNFMPLVNEPGESFTLEFQSADIDSSVDGGFFTGDTRGIHTLIEDDGASITHTYEGKWGGQFYRDEAGSVAGTFGGHSSNNPDSPGFSLTFIGAFHAVKQPSP